MALTDGDRALMVAIERFIDSILSRHEPTAALALMAAAVHARMINEYGFTPDEIGKLAAEGVAMQRRMNGRKPDLQ